MSLEGLRAIAIISIVLYHLAVSWLPSGHMGVVMFLVLSGYLVTCSILKALNRDGASSLPRLWLRRIARIWPSNALMIVVTVAACALFNHVLLTKLRPDLVPSLLLANNVGAILRGASYFDNLGGTSPLTHLWYLGVDLQFFLVWSIVLAVLCPNGRPNKTARLATLALAAVSAILMGVLFDPNGDPTRVYYGPDTRAFAPLLGAWLALAWPLGGRSQRLDAAHHTVRDAPLFILGPVALAGIVAVMVLTPDTSPFLYRGGMLLVALLSAILLASLLERGTPLAQVCSLKPLTWLGERSFGIYLWHFPLFQLFKVTQSATSPVMVMLALALSVGCAEVSLRFVDRSIAQGRIPFLPSPQGDRRGAPTNYVAWIPAGMLVLIVAGGATGLALSPDETAVPEGAIVSTGEGAATAVDLSKRQPSKKSDADDSIDDEDSKKNSDSSKKKKSDEDDSDSSSSSKKKSSTDPDDLPEGSIVLVASDESVDDGKVTPLIVADSIAGDTAWYIEDHMPGAFLDSYVGRQPSQAASVLEQYIDQGVVGDIVVVASFSNMPATENDLETMHDLCDGRTLYLVNVHIPEVEEAQINEILADFAEQYDDVKLIDWNAESEGHDDWFYDDETHLNEKGQPRYGELIANAIAKDFALAGGEVLTEEEAEDANVKSTGGSLVIDPTATD